MTCVVGYAMHGRAWIGADALSGGDDGWHVRIMRTPKVARIAVAPGKGQPEGIPLVLGFTSSWRMGQILQTAAGFGELETPPLVVGDPQAHRHAVWRWMVTQFVEAARGAMKRGGYAEVKDSRESGGEFLVGVRGVLFQVGSDYQATEPLLVYDAVGAGARVALGALFALTSMGAKDGEGNDFPPEDYIRVALEAAQEFNGAVRGPFTIVST